MLTYEFFPQCFGESDKPVSDEEMLSRAKPRLDKAEALYLQNYTFLPFFSNSEKSKQLEAEYKSACAEWKRWNRICGQK